MEKRIIFLLLFLLAAGIELSAQGDLLLERGIHAHQRNNLEKADSLYRASLEHDPGNPIIRYNLGDIAMKSENFEDAEGHFSEVIRNSDDEDLKSDAFFKLGNSYFHQQKLEESLESYKNSLRANPNNDAARYNLSVLQQMLQQQQQQQQQNQDQNQDNEDQDQENQDQQNQDQQNQNQEGGEQEGEDQENQDQEGEGEQDQDQDQEGENSEQEEQDKEQPGRDEQNQDDSNQDDQKESQAIPQQISKEDAEKMLDALNMREKKLQEGMRKKSKSSDKKIEKDW